MEGAGPPESALRSISVAVGALADLVQHMATPRVASTRALAGRYKLRARGKIQADSQRCCRHNHQGLSGDHQVSQTVTPSSQNCRGHCRCFASHCTPSSCTLSRQSQPRSLQTGDGSTLYLLLTAELLRCVQALSAAGVPPAACCRQFRVASALAAESITRQAAICTEPSAADAQSKILRLCQSCLSTKLRRARVVPLSLLLEQAAKIVGAARALPVVLRVTASDRLAKRLSCQCASWAVERTDWCVG